MKRWTAEMLPVLEAFEPSAEAPRALVRDKEGERVKIELAHGQWGHGYHYRGYFGFGEKDWIYVVAASGSSSGALAIDQDRRIYRSYARVSPYLFVSLSGKAELRSAADFLSSCPLRTWDRRCCWDDVSEMSPATAAPVVVRTQPASGAADVDPNLNEVAVTFSKDMQKGTSSWEPCGNENFPKVRVMEKGRYLDDSRTCALPVKLDPGRTYALWINSANADEFMDTGGRSSVPYLLVFQTRK
jgi:RNA polymerase sigma-70 factor (ECF subfamily)